MTLDVQSLLVVMMINMVALSLALDGLASLGLRQASVLVLTAYDAIEDRVKGLDMGADDYMPKPFAFPELEARVRVLARRAQAIKSSEIQLGALSLDTVGRRARIDGTGLYADLEAIR